MKGVTETYILHEMENSELMDYQESKDEGSVDAFWADFKPKTGLDQDELVIVMICHIILLIGLRQMRY